MNHRNQSGLRKGLQGDLFERDPQKVRATRVKARPRKRLRFSWPTLLQASSFRKRWQNGVALLRPSELSV
eukprot:2567377-Amphidinium_carterae.1